MSEEKEQTKKLTLNEQAEKILEIAEENGVQANFFFVTTFKRYKVQINILTELETQIKKDGVLVTKQCVKGRENIYSHPAISDYNRTTDSANKTVTTLMKIIKTLGKKDESPDEMEDPLYQALCGGIDDTET